MLLKTRPNINVVESPNNELSRSTNKRIFFIKRTTENAFERLQ